MTTPAEEFAEIFTPSEQAAEPEPVSRLPKPNLAQGVVADPPRADPATEFAQALADGLTRMQGVVR